MPRVWGGDDITKPKSVFVWPSAAARAAKEGMVTVTFKPGMSEEQVKELVADDLGLECAPEDIKTLVDGYGADCESLSDISLNRKGYHVAYQDERTMEMKQLKLENERLKAELSSGGGGGKSNGGGDDENRRLRKENADLKEEIRSLKAQLKGGSSMSKGIEAKPVRERTPPKKEPPAAKPARRGSFETVAPKGGSKPAAAKRPPTPPPAGPMGESKGDRIQDMALKLPTGADDGERNYAKVQGAWLKGPRTESGEPLEKPEDEEYGVDDLMLSERPKQLKNPVPLQSLITTLAGQWMADNVL